MSSPATAPFLATVLLLAGAGLSKLRRPDYSARALRSAGLPARRAAVRVGAAAELGVAVWALVEPGPFTGGLVAASYAAFCAFVTLALRKGWVLSSCGCFGRPDTPPTKAHAGLDAGASAVAAWWATSAPHNLGAILDNQPWAGVPLMLLSIILAGLGYLVWSNPLPAALAAGLRRGERR